jgi:transcriptional regulator with XRE-family HTH domain
MGLPMQEKGRHVQPHSGPEKAFGQALQKLRLEAGLSQEQLGFECEFDRTYISLLERGIRSPTLRTMFKLCGPLNVSFPDLARQVQHFLARQPPRKR